MKVEVRPIDREKWHGKSGQESFTRPHTISALARGSTMKYAHGLSEEDMALLKKKGCSYDLTDDFKDGVPHPFWESKMASIRLENKTMFLKPVSSMLDFIKVKICKESVYIANSKKELEEGLWPFATHIIFDEALEVEAKATKVEIKNNAIIRASELPVEKKIQLLMIIGGKDVKGKSNSHIEVKLAELIDDNAREVLNYIKMDPDQTEVHALVLQCLLKNILRKNGHKIEYKGSNIGGSVEDAISYLTKDENNELRLRLTQEVLD